LNIVTGFLIRQSVKYYFLFFESRILIIVFPQSDYDSKEVENKAAPCDMKQINSET